MRIRPTTATPGYLAFELSDRSSTRTLWYEWDADRGHAEPDVAHMGALAALSPALASDSTELYVDGHVEAEFLRRLQQWADAWAFLRPDIFSPIRVDAAGATASGADLRGSPSDARPYSAAVAFSGGVDSVFALLRHLAEIEEADSSRRPLLALVHGFDIAVDATDSFAVARRGAEEFGEMFGIDVVWVATNWKEEFSPAWTSDFTTGLAAALNVWAGVASRSIIGSDDGGGYNFDSYPWASNPATNHLLGSIGYPFETIDFISTRPQKCAVIAEHPGLLDTLRVCYQSTAGGENCGRCEKCVRTKLALAAIGVRETEALGAFDIADLAGVHRHKLHNYRHILDHEPQRLTSAEQRWLRLFLLREGARGRVRKLVHSAKRWTS